MEIVCISVGFSARSEMGEHGRTHGRTNCKAACHSIKRASTLSRPFFGAAFHSACRAQWGGVMRRRLVGNIGRLPGHRLPRPISLCVHIGEPGFEFVVAEVEFGATSDHCSISELTDFHVFALDGPIVGAARRNGVYDETLVLILAYWRRAATMSMWSPVRKARYWSPP